MRSLPELDDAHHLKYLMVQEDVKILVAEIMEAIPVLEILPKIQVVMAIGWVREMIQIP